jgi:mannosyltransferase OCH1-like enzyme
MTTAPEEASSAQRRLRQVPKPLIMCFIFSLIGIMKMRVLTQKYKPDISEKYYHHRVKGTGADTQDDDIGNKTRRQNMRTPESNLTHTCLSDVSLPKATTHLDGRPIPKTIHFIVQSKCLPMEVANAHTKHWESISDHSVLYHDQTFIDAYMAQPRKDFPAVAQKYKCAMDPMAKMDLAKLMLLWDNGGSAVDFGHIAGPAFQDGKYISDTDECMFEVDEELNVNPRFLACKPRHSALYAAIVRFITVPFVDYTPLFPYTQKTRSETIGFVRSFMTMGNENEREGRGQFEGDGIVLINATAIDGDLFTSLPMKDGTFNETRLQLIPKQEQEQCNAILRNDSYKVDIKGLLDLVEYGKENSTCPNSLHFIGSKFNERSIVEGRKIPKIVHMTSKSRCFAKEFVDAIDAWRFEDYSILIHDDATADKLMSREWPEFPLLQEARSCITTGAGMADLWRYLILWEYGGKKVGFYLFRIFILYLLRRVPIN